MKILRLILAIIVVAVSSYGLTTGNSEVLIPYALLFLGLMLLVTGITEFKERRKANAIILFIVTGFSFFVAAYTF
ncbi:hypothetical protein CWR48_10430 [Oceanobacillus arenosus]|uniref:DUF3953 domain-containing protein n=1 Tax=Oceanobacillus arenosus TaxID=1229153 RepID=A0A3D8PU98_9BACI|nr:DUF3953 domain-containing protein [Oceanobacillus arenosus]RDW18729.1 hypothetical protein CWR48_10430 [Oceanobacillus arenosus]